MARRVMLAATASGSGKTTVTCAVLAALKAQGLDVVSFKCGPDYIDPMFHKKALGVESRNLDIFLMGEAGVRQSIAEQTLGRPGQPGQAAAGTPAAPAAPGTPAAPVEHNISLRLQTVAVIEGVMGLYDGLGMGSYASSNHLSLLTQTPVVLIVNAKGAARSLAATIQGFLGYAQNNIRGVI
ncbi:MAG: hypothetical protein FWF30_04255, partial [Coriobacteriia bacterium]|nr:hypothetical protein [Coriobacteriia bacterium]